MAGPVARRFVEAIEFSLAHEIVQTAKNQPKRIIFYLYLDGSDYGEPHSMICKYEKGMTDDQYKARTFGRDETFTWDILEPVFNTIDECAKYIADFHCPEPDRYCIGTTTKSGGAIYPNGALYVGDLSNRSTAREWLRESYTMYADYLLEMGLVDEDDQEMQWGWIEDDEDHLRELLDDQISYLAMLAFTEMDF